MLDPQLYLGPYIGPSGRAELIATLRASAPHRLLVVVEEAADQRVRFHHGWLDTVDADGWHSDADDARLVVAEAHELADHSGKPDLRPQAPCPLDVPDGEVEQHTGGFVVRVAGCLYAVVLSHPALHPTDGGEFVPGLGQFEAA